MEHITIYAAGEIHSDWRDHLRTALADRGVDADLVGPQEVHDRSDAVGEDILGTQPDARYRDLMGARVNALRTRVLMDRAEVAVAFSARSTSSGTRPPTRGRPWPRDCR